MSRPVPPPVIASPLSGTQQIVSQFCQDLSALTNEYNYTSMTSGQADQDASQLLDNAVNSLAYSDAPLSDRLSALQQLVAMHDQAPYTTYVSSAQEQAYTQELMGGGYYQPVSPIYDPVPPPVSPTYDPVPPPVDPGAGSVPSDATAVCQDGSISYSQHASGTCSDHGGVGYWVNHP